jgi:TldD protein
MVSCKEFREVFMPDEALLEKVLKRAVSGGGGYADLYIEFRKSTLVMMEESRIEKAVTGTVAGFGIRLIRDRRTAYGYSNDFSESSMNEIADTVRAAVADLSPTRTDIILNMTKRHPVFIPVIKISPESVPMQAKIAMLREGDETARKFSEAIRQVNIVYRDSSQRVKIFSSDGYIAEDERIYTTALVQVIACKGDLIQTGYETEGGMTGFELFSDRPLREIAGKAAERAIRMLVARRAPGGRMPVVISSEAGGTMIHEAIGHGLEADLAQQNLSVYSGKLGQQVASPVITVIDDSTIPGKRGSFAFDDEGSLSRKNILVEKGMLRGYLYDKATAALDNTESTGNGRRESYANKPIPRMTNTFIAPGQERPEEIIGSVNKGLLVKKMGGGQVNTVTGNFVFGVQEGYLIENGKIGEMVRGATLIGSGPEVLGSIDMVGSDLGFSIGTCGKDGQGVPVSDALPTLRIKEIVVGGEISQNDN